MSANKDLHGRRQDTAGATAEEKRKGLAERGVTAPHPPGGSKRSDDNSNKTD